MNVKGFLRVTKRLAPENPLQDLGDRYEIEGRRGRCIFSKKAGLWDVHLFERAEFTDEQGRLRTSRTCRRFPKHLDYRQVNGWRVYLGVPSTTLNILLPALGIRKKKKGR